MDQNVNLNELASRIHDNAVSKGFWVSDNKSVLPEKLCLVHSELSEALEALRSNNPKSVKLGSEFTLFEEELADAIIRILDITDQCGCDIHGAVLAKMDYNKGREWLHGKLF
jgi:hypothetical protein